MRLVTTGLTWNTTPLQVLEHAALTTEETSRILRYVKDAESQAVILSTCNRTEVYALAPSGNDAEGFVEGLIGHLWNGPADSVPYLSTMEHTDDMEHLLRVVCVLDSFILGETEILGQVRYAYRIASQAGVAGGALGHIFRHALRVGKRAQTETDISRNPLSMSAACVELARRTVGDLREKTVLVIGVGEAGQLAAKALKSHGARGLFFANRSYKRATQEASDWGATSVPFEQILSLIHI